MTKTFEQLFTEISALTTDYHIMKQGRYGNVEYYMEVEFKTPKGTPISFKRGGFASLEEAMTHMLSEMHLLGVHTFHALAGPTIDHDEIPF